MVSNCRLAQLTVLAIITMLAAFLLAACGTETSQSQTTVEQSPEVAGLVQKYMDMKHLGMAGQVDEFIADVVEPIRARYGDALGGEATVEV